VSPERDSLALCLIRAPSGSGHPRDRGEIPPHTEPTKRPRADDAGPKVELTRSQSGLNGACAPFDLNVRKDGDHFDEHADHTGHAEPANETHHAPKRATLVPSDAFDHLCPDNTKISCKRRLNEGARSAPLARRLSAASCCSAACSRILVLEGC